MATLLVNGSTLSANQDASSVQTVVFSGTINGSSYDSAVWEIYGPVDSAVTTASWTVTNSTQTFTPDVPGRYLVRLTVTNVSTNTPETYSCLSEVRDPQVPQASIPAPNEEDEYDGNEGWSRSTEAFLRTMSRGLPFKNIVSVTLTPGVVSSGQPSPIVANSVVVLDESINGPLEVWKACAIEPSGTKGNNLVLSVSAVDSDDAVAAQGILFYLLEDLAVGEKALALVSGVVNVTTTGWSNGDDVYLSNTSPFLNNAAPPSPQITRKVGLVLKGGSAGNATPNPGAIYFNGIGPLLSNFIGAQPAGSDKQVQFKDGNSFAGANLYYDKVNVRLGVNRATPSTTLDVDGGITLNTTAVTAAQSPYSALITDYAIFCDTSSGPLSINLPGTNVTGRTLIIKDAAGSAGTNNITLNINLPGSDTIDGGTSLVISVNYGSVTLQCSSTFNWSIITYS